MRQNVVENLRLLVQRQILLVRENDLVVEPEIPDSSGCLRVSHVENPLF
ncbi:MAG: hypothetical protein MJZ81_07250 [Bacteroidales bacterium]|nr:hypothetical protein [Bacteroidales bacterium]